MIARGLSRDFYDTDAVYEETYGETIAATFKNSGEAVFRTRETEILSLLCGAPNAVIATGGGIVLRERNVLTLKEHCLVIELCALPETIFERVKDNAARPLLSDMRISTIEQLYASRKDLYAAARDMRICTDGKSPAGVAEEAAAWVQEAIGHGPTV